MPVLLECPSGHRLKIPSKLAGHTIVCPVCEEKLEVPPLTAPPPAPPPLLRPVTKPTPKRETDRPKNDAGRAEVSSKPSLAPETMEKSKVAMPVEPGPIPEITQSQISDLDSRISDSRPQISNPESQTSNPGSQSSDSKSEILDSKPQASDQESPSPNHALESEATVQPPPVAIDPQLPQATTDQPWSTMQALDADQLELSIPIPVDNELFSEEQSYLIDQVVAEKQTGPTWVVIDDAPAQQRTNSLSNPQPPNASVFLLALGAVVVAALTAIPAVLEHITAAQVGGQPDRWTYIVLLGAVVQVAVAILASCIPDWSTQWIGALVTTGFSTMYALGLALTMFARQDHALVRDLGLLDEAFHRQAQPWCFLVLCMTLILAFCYGRASLRWYYSEKQLLMSRTAPLP